MSRQSFANIAKDMTQQKDRIIYKAAKQEAEAVIFINEPDIEELDCEGMRIVGSQKYKICDDLLEVKGAKTALNNFYWVEVPNYLIRIAKETDGYTMFQQKLKQEHPNGDKLYE